MEWLKEAQGVEAVLLAGGMLVALFGWEIFRLARLAVGVVVGSLLGWGIASIVALPAGLAERGAEPLHWMLLLVLAGAVCGFVAVRLIRSLASFVPGMVLGFLAAKACLHWLGSEEGLWSFSPPAALLAAAAGGAAVLVNERIAVILMTAAIGSGLAGEALPGKWFVPVFFVLSAPLQWWVQAGRPWPFRRRGEDEEGEF